MIAIVLRPLVVVGLRLLCGEIVVGLLAGRDVLLWLRKAPIPLCVCYRCRWHIGLRRRLPLTAIATAALIMGLPWVAIVW